MFYIYRLRIFILVFLHNLSLFLSFFTLFISYLHVLPILILVSSLCHLILFCIQKAYDQQTQMMQIGQNKHQVFQLFMAMGYFVPWFDHYFKNNQYEDKEGINQCRFKFQARGEHRKYKILFQTWIPFSVFI